MDVDERPGKIRKTEDGNSVTTKESDHVVNSNADLKRNGHNTSTPLNETGIENSKSSASAQVEADSIDEHAAMTALPPGPGNDQPKALSKNQQKKLRRKERWDAKKTERQAKRKEIRVRRREARRAQREAGEACEPRRNLGEGTGRQLPVTFVFDCSFDELMNEKEIVSLSGQLTRCYADNRRAAFRAHLAVSSFGGRLQERFDAVMGGVHRSWHGFRFCREDFVHVAGMARGWMEEGEKEKGDDAGASGGAIKLNDATASASELVYLSSDSENFITELKPNSTYIIGGLVDRNRHKGICHKTAVDRGIRTAKLPIGEYLDMSSRQVLTTNHVMEIMLKWMEFGDWGRAFVEVIPKRKGGVLKGKDENAGEGEGEGEEVVSLVIEPSSDDSDVQSTHDDEEEAEGMDDPKRQASELQRTIITDSTKDNHEPP